MSQRLLEEIAATLDGYQAQAIAAMAVVHGIDGQTRSRKPELIKALVPRLASMAAMREIVERLQPAQREALTFVARRSSPVPVRSVLAVLRAQVLDADTAEALLVELLKTGALLYATSIVPWKLDFSSKDPTFLMRHLWLPQSAAALVSEVGGWAALVQPSPAPATVNAGDSAPLVRDLYLFARSVRARPLRLTQQGLPHQADMRRLVSEVRPHVEAKQWRAVAADLAFTFYLCYAAGLLEVQGTQLEVAPTAETFFQAPLALQVVRLYAAWQVLEWSELDRVPGLMVDHYMNSYGDIPEPSQLSTARRVLGEALTELSDGRWWSVGDLSQALRRRDPDFLMGGEGGLFGMFVISSTWASLDRQDEHYHGVRRADTDYGRSLLRRHEDWELVEGAYIRQVLREPLRWLGIVDAGVNDAGEVVSVRVTDLGRAVLNGQGGLPRRAAPGTPRIVVQPNFEVIVLDMAGALDAVTRLDQFAMLQSADRAAVYKLTREPLVRTLQAGAHLADIEAFLEAESQTPLPQNVRYTLAEWGRQAERVRVCRGVTLLEAGTGAELDTWLADPALAPLLGARLSATVVVVSSENEATLAGVLRRRGMLEVEDAAGDRHTSVRLRNDGVLSVRHEDFGRFERYRLTSIADLIDEHASTVTLCMTAASAARARELGWTAAMLLGLLRRRTGAEVPADLALSIRGWLGDFPAALQSTVRLIQLPDPAFWPVVERAAGGSMVARVASTLIAVDETGLGRVMEALGARGIEVAAATPERVASPLLKTEAPAVRDSDLQTLRGRALRDFLDTAISAGRYLKILHQTATQRSPKRQTVEPRAVVRRPSGYYLLALTERGTERSFKLDDIFGVAVEERA